MAQTVLLLLAHVILALANSTVPTNAAVTLVPPITLGIANTNCTVLSAELVCQECALGSALVKGSCVPCASAACNTCADGPNQCTSCSASFGLTADGGCAPCQAGCAVCSSDASACQTCLYGYGLDLANARGSGASRKAQCVPCKVDNCDDCLADAAVCKKCGYGYGPDKASGTCAQCADPNCQDCAADYAVCALCTSQYGPANGDGTGMCEPCPSLDKGSQCWSCKGGICSDCVGGFGLAQGGKGCLPCADEKCFNCTSDYRTCSFCYAYAGPGPNGACTDCADSACLECSSSFDTCSSCFEGAGLSSNGSCTNCLVKGCKNCTADASICVACDTFAELPDVGDACEPCDLKDICVNQTRSDPYSGAPMTYVSPYCAGPEYLLQPTEVYDNGTICGSCGPLATTPMPVDAQFFVAAQDVLMEYLARAKAGNVSGGAAAAICPGSVGPGQANVMEAIGYCGSVFQKSGFGNSTLDVRFAAVVQCGEGTGGTFTQPSLDGSPGAQMVVDGLPGGKLQLLLRGIWNQEFNSFPVENGGGPSKPKIFLVEELA